MSDWTDRMNLVCFEPLRHERPWELATYLKIGGYEAWKNILAGKTPREQVIEMVKASGLRFGYGLSLKSARQWGLYISASRGKTSIGIEEPALFSEPGVFIVRPDGTLYYGAVQTMPFARPSFQDLLGAIDFAIAKDYPARGEYTGEV